MAALSELFTASTSRTSLLAAGRLVVKTNGTIQKCLRRVMVVSFSFAPPLFFFAGQVTWKAGRRLFHDCPRNCRGGFPFCPTGSSGDLPAAPAYRTLCGVPP